MAENRIKDFQFFSLNLGGKKIQRSAWKALEADGAFDHSNQNPIEIQSNIDRNSALNQSVGNLFIVTRKRMPFHFF